MSEQKNLDEMPMPPSERLECSCKRTADLLSGIDPAVVQGMVDALRLCADWMENEVEETGITPPYLNLVQSRLSEIDSYVHSPDRLEVALGHIAAGDPNPRKVASAALAATTGGE